jgi:NitT/TauT family transport system substrate-binding protein
MCPRTQTDGRDSAGADGSGEQRRSVSRRGLLAAGGASAVAALAGCLGGSSGDGGSTPAGTATGTATETESVESVSYRNRYKRVGIGTGMNDAAIATGLWEEEGLDVSFKPSSGSTAAAKAVASGKDTFGNGEAVAPLSLMEKAESLVVVGQLYDPLEGIVTTGEHGITTWTDLEGKTVGQSPQGGNITKVALRRKGVDLSKIDFQNVQSGSGTQLLISGQIDASMKWFVLEEPRLKSRGYSPTVLPSAPVLNHLGVTLFTRQEVVDNQPELVNDFVRGWLKAHKLFATNVDKVFEVYEPKASEYFNPELNREALPTFHAAQAPPKSIGQEHGKGWIPSSKVERTIDVLEDADMLDGSLSTEAAYTNEFIERNEDLAVETANAIYDRLSEFDIGPDYV